MARRRQLWRVPRISPYFFWLAVGIILAFLAFFLTISKDEKPRYQVQIWSHLNSWDDHDFSGAEDAYQRSCTALAKQDGDKLQTIGPFTFKRQHWINACERVINRTQSLKSALEQAYHPVSIKVDGEWAGHFTGYYVPLLKGSLTPSLRYPIPLYRRPSDLVDVDLGLFRKDLKGQRISGRLNGRSLLPHADRAAIDAGALKDEGLELLWVSSAIDAFFLHIQGSGYVALESGDHIKVGYDGQNGHPYHAIGRSLIDAGEVAPEEMSLQAIAAWMMANPDRSEALMQENKSYIFFRTLSGNGVLGAQGVELTPGRSMAVDRSLIPYGAPLWVETELADGHRFRQFMVAQDTGGAIKGAGRGDIFFGLGPEALEKAGPMNARGRMTILIPKTVFESQPHG